MRRSAPRARRAIDRPFRSQGCHAHDHRLPAVLLTINSSIFRSSSIDLGCPRHTIRPSRPIKNVVGTPEMTYFQYVESGFSN